MRLPRPEILAAVALLAAGCASAPLPATRTVILRPPESLLRDCDVPKMAFRTNGDLVKGVAALRSALASCADDKRLIREYLDEAEAALRSGP